FANCQRAASPVPRSNRPGWQPSVKLPSGGAALKRSIALWVETPPSCEAAEASACGGSLRVRGVDIRTPVRRGWRHGLRRKGESVQAYCKDKELCTRRKGRRDSSCTSKVAAHTREGNPRGWCRSGRRCARSTRR